MKWHKYNGKNLICGLCNKEFYTPLCRITAKFCSRKCADLFKRKSIEHKKAVRKLYYQINKDYINARQLVWSHRNIEKRKIIKNRWRAKNKERTNFLSRMYHYRQKNAKGKTTFEEMQELYKNNPICVYCGKNKSNTIDHIKPLSQGGSNNFENLIACCVSCNSKKGDRSLIKWKPAFYYFNEKLNKVVFNR